MGTVSVRVSLTDLLLRLLCDGGGAIAASGRWAGAVWAVVCRLPTLSSHTVAGSLRPAEAVTLEEQAEAAVRLLPWAGSASSINITPLVTSATCCSSVMESLAVLSKNFVSLGKIHVNLASSFFLFLFLNPLWGSLRRQLIWHKFSMQRYTVQEGQRGINVKFGCKYIGKYSYLIG